MAINSKPFYWLSCDTPSCGAVHPDEAGEVIAYSDLAQVIDLAAESEWLVVSGQHYCGGCSDLYCRKCGTYLSGGAGRRRVNECFTCSPEHIAWAADL